MSKRTRQILYIVFLLLFVILVPLISLYAAGYTLAGGLKLQKTGILIIDTLPEEAIITLNGKTQKSLAERFFLKTGKFVTTPTKIKNLAPGDYDVKLTKEGYWDWQKKLPVRPGESTYIEDVCLFKKSVPEIAAIGGFERISISPDKNYMAAFSRGNAALLDLRENTVSALGLSTTTRDAAEAMENLPEPSWSQSGSRLSWIDTVFSVDDWENPISLRSEIGTGTPDLFRWNGDNELFYRLGGKIFMVNLKNGQLESFNRSDLWSDFWISGNDSYAVENIAAESYFVAYSDLFQKERARVRLPGTNYSIKERIGNDFYIAGNIDKKLYIVDPYQEYKPIKDTLDNVYLYAHADKNRILYSGPSEIWLYETETKKKTLLTRLSKVISSLAWHPSNNYIVYSADGSIFTLELDNREKYNITEIFKLESLRAIDLDKEGDSAYFVAEIGSQKGLYRLDIQ